MFARCPLEIIASIGGCGRSWAGLRPTRAMSTATAMPTTMPRRTTGCARCRDSQALPDRAAISAARRAFEEGRGDHRAQARKYAPRDGCRSLLAWRGSRRSTAFHGQPSSGCWMPIASRAGCPMDYDRRAGQPILPVVARKHEAPLRSRDGKAHGRAIQGAFRLRKPT